MSLPGAMDRARGGGEGKTLTLPPGTRVDASLDGDVDEDADAGSESMEALLAAVAAAPSVRIDRREGVGIEPGTLVDGTYRVLRRLGGGGMGVVYLAEHVELQRQVALKLHLGELDSQELLRLRREARVMARLSHPNVLAVHGVGTHDGRMFIAMAFAEGGTLKTWLEAGPRPWRETVGMLAEAGRGLAAAHRVGVVHRDFKPDNVLIGADGRPLVADFGLARRWDEGFEPVTGAESSSSSGSLVPLGDAHRFTVTGAVVGTPAYMSPEQFDGIEVGPGSDQFSFCVVLYEALIGRRPFGGRTTLELAAAVHMGKVQPVPAGVRVPGAVLSLLLRGLRPVPGDRHASMEALVAALERTAGARARRTRWAAGGATLGAALLVGNQVAVMAAPVPCESAEHGLESAWDPARRDAVAAAWPAAAADQASGLAAIDAWAGDWRARRREVCEATRVREEQSELALTLRMACLDRMAARLDALTGELAEGGDGEPSAALVRSSLPPLTDCDDVAELDRLVNRFSSATMRSSPERDRAWTAAEGLLAQADAREQLGRPGVVELVEQALALARRHELPVVEVHALMLLADERTKLGGEDEAATLHERALRLALGLGLDEAVTELVLGRAEVAIEAGRPDDAAIHLSYFDALIARLGSPEVALPHERRARVVRGRLALAQERAAVAVEELAPLADDAGAELSLRLDALRTLGRAHMALGRPDHALATWERLAALVEAEQGPDSFELVAALNNIATAQSELGRPDEALRALVRAEGVATRTVGAEHPFMVPILTNRGIAERKLGRLPEARALQEQALALRTRLHGDGNPGLAFNLDELGELGRLRGDHTAALAHLARSLRLREDAVGAEHPSLVATLVLQARVRLDTGAQAEAQAVLDRARALVEREGADLVDRAEVELLLAKAAAVRDPVGARRLGVAAQEHASAGGAAGNAVRDEARAWIASHPADPAAKRSP